MCGDDYLSGSGDICDYPPSSAEIDVEDYFIPTEEGQTKLYPIKVMVTWDSSEYSSEQHTEESTDYVNITPNATTDTKYISHQLPDFKYSNN